MPTQLVYIILQKLRMLTAPLFVIAVQLVFTATPIGVYANEDPDIEETTLTLTVKGLGSTEIEVWIKDESAYLPVTVLFDYLKIKNEADENYEIISGFLSSAKDVYQIDSKNGQIHYQEKSFPLTATDFIRTPNGLFLKSAIFGQVFGLDCNFNFRGLSVNVIARTDLPVFREMQQQLMRQNRDKLNQKIITDTTINSRYKAFNPGMADWSVTSTQQPGHTANTLLNLNLGGVVAGGETNLNLYHNTNYNFNLRQQNYLWRYVDNNNPLMRQLSLGKIGIQSTASILSPVIGMQVTNSSTLYRKSFGTYTLSDYTSPEWTVELYINNVLIDYTKADASGFFSFQVPVVYGNSVIRLRFYGPWGEEQTKEQQINVPYNFVPKNELEYTASSGIVEDGRQSRFSRVGLKYGVSQRFTFGSGIEYLSSIALHPAIPFVSSTVLLATNFILSADYAMGVKGRAIASYRLADDLLFELNYTRYKEGQKAILNNYLEERKAMVSKTFRGTSFSGMGRLSINQIQYATARQTIADALLSCTWRQFSSNLSTYALAVDQQVYNVYSNLSLSFNLPLRYTLRPQTQYNYREKKLNNARIEVEKKLFGNGYLNVMFENNFLYHLQNLSLGVRFDLSFMRASFYASRTHNTTLFSQSVSGGAIFDYKSKYIQFNNHSNVGRAGLIFYPYLDLNANNKRDQNEPKIKGLQLKINGGRIQNSPKDTTISVFDLEPYTSYVVEMNQNGFDNIAWHLSNVTYKIAVDPNQLKVIEVPVQVSGEVSGTVYQTDSTGVPRLTVFIYRDGHTLVGSAVTENDGYYNFLGLPPGTYTARLNPIQLGKLKMKTTPVLKNFKIRALPEGDVVNAIDFKVEFLK